MRTAEELAGLMATSEINAAGQLIQTRHRLRLAERWAIAPGMRILELACGQGDMTAVLADAVGPDGHVTAIDLADPSYGAPVSLGASAARLRASPLGARIDVRFRCDVLDPRVTFPDNAFDAVVLAHGAWYFESVDRLRRTLARVRPWAARLHVAEWDFTPRSYDQIAHFLAVTIQGEVEAHLTDSDANVRTPFPRARFESLLAEAGWEIAAQTPIETAELQDGAWEVENCLNIALPTAESLDLPPRVKDLIASQGEVLRSLAGTVPIRPLPAYAITAARRDDIGERR